MRKAMGKQFKSDLRDLDKLNVRQQAFSLKGIPRRRRGNSIQKRLLRSALELGKSANASFEPPLECLDLTDSPPTMSIAVPTTVPVGMGTPAGGGGPVNALTGALGAEGSAFAVVGVTAQGGLYGSSTGEFGAYGSVSGGWWSNIGTGLGPVFNWIYGPPSDLEAASFAVGADVGATQSVEVLLLFSDISKSPFRFLGFSFSFSFLPSKLPFDITVQVSLLSGIKPLVKF
jgi:hypothetical protein